MKPLTEKQIFNLRRLVAELRALTTERGGEFEDPQGRRAVEEFAERVENYIQSRTAL